MKSPSRWGTTPEWCIKEQSRNSPGELASSSLHVVLADAASTGPFNSTWTSLRRHNDCLVVRIFAGLSSSNIISYEEEYNRILQKIRKAEQQYSALLCFPSFCSYLSGSGGLLRLARTNSTIPYINWPFVPPVVPAGSQTKPLDSLPRLSVSPPQP